MDRLVPDPDSPLTASVLALPREEDRLRFSRFEANGVALGLVKAGSGALLQLVGHIIDVVALDDPSDVVDEGDASTVLYLALDSLVDFCDVERREQGRQGSPGGGPSSHPSPHRPGRRRS